ncbi:hypothetical protein JW758_00740 [Candidatus Peregrinibacteria bacterium]|nr:hypothetical protein [Candidatus Peregrinibacteria bacterium]
MINRFLEKISGKWIFLIVVTTIYIFLLIFNFHSFERVLIQFFKLIWTILPIFVLVFCLMFLSNLFLDSKKIIKYTGKSAGLKGWIISIIAGILSSGPIYMWYPLLSELKDKGMKDAFITTFLYNRAVKIPLLPMIIYYFGITFTIILTFYMILFSVINGLIVHKFLNLKKP